ncbi:MAG: alpha-galactosidase, partial [Bryobacteraceae bacterium]
MIRKLLACGAWLLLGAAVSWAQPESRVSVTAAGWTVSADPGSGTLGVTYEKLGVLMEQVRLNMRDANGTRPLKNWTVERRAPNRLILKTAQPQAGWLFELRPNLLKISTTLDNALITAELPASKERIPARLLDPLGVPVDWVGTNEVAGGYGGSETRNPSFLPRKNADCMYFALGQVASPTFTSLFDRKTDFAISFPDETRMERNRRDRDVLDLTLPVSGNAAVRLTPDYYTRTLGVPYYSPFDDSYFDTAPMVWSSWTSYYEAVSEADVVRNADWLAANLKPYGFQYVQLDDGYDRGKNGEHYWIENWDKEKFPHGPQWMTSYIKSKGLRAGLWLVPNSYAGAVEQHPDWYLRYKNGNLILDYKTPALDSTNPEVIDHLRRLFQTLDDWGFEYYKFDGEHALPRYVPNVDRERLKDKAVDSLVNYR